jgi:hypothetical protein
MQWAYFRSHVWSANQHINISQGIPIDVPNHLLYLLHVQHHVQKARGSRSMLHTNYIIFNMHIAAYKKYGDP